MSYPKYPKRREVGLDIGRKFRYNVAQSGVEWGKVEQKGEKLRILQQPQRTFVQLG